MVEKEVLTFIQKIKIIFAQKKHNNQNELDYLYTQHLENNNTDFSHISKCFGWIHTDKGEGLIFQRIENYDKSPIRTFSYMSKYNLLSDMESFSLVNDLHDYLFENNILFADASLSNIFVQKTDASSNKLIVFDGLGARRTGLKFWLYRHSKLYTQYKIKKQWEVFLKNHLYERSLKLIL